MASNPERDKPKTRSLLTGTAQPVKNSVARAMEHFKRHPDPTVPPAKERKTLRTKRPADNDAEEAQPEAEADTPEANSEDQDED
jgi:hypothetical protein